MRIAVWGAGALGLLWGARLTKLFPDTVLITRTKEQQSYLQTNGIQLTTLSGKVEQIPVQALWVEELRKVSVIDYLFLMVKQTELPGVIRLLSRIGFRDTTILMWQNGVGHEAYLSEYRDRYGAITTEGARRDGLNSVTHTGKGMTWIGPFEDFSASSRITLLVSRLKEAGISVEMEESIGKRMWSKLMINCAINPLTALLRIPNGALLHIPEGKAAMEQILSEAVQVANALDYSMNLEETVEQALDVCRKTSPNHSSMLQDLLNGRLTEIEAINGAIVRFGEQLGIETPVNRLLVQLIHAAEKNSQGE